MNEHSSSHSSDKKLFKIWQKKKFQTIQTESQIYAKFFYCKLIQNLHIIFM